ncbi:hypothetical protein K474DRAFT_1667726 [Panus rudis PR-1116 ss-1]|nr:hypothetical protein K474DRAFT_1667726 [Panus rudis PR-1116 ss-1]
MALGGLSAAMFSGSSSVWSLNMPWHKVDLQSLFFASMFAIILVVLAYLTNPSETSFRTYLTEQSFRQHLRRLDDDDQDDSDEEEAAPNHRLVKRAKPALQKPSRSYADSNPPFHFVNRASVSLRTPKHVFHSFGVFTVAAIVPNGSRQNRSEGTGSMVSDSWYIGAFGRWWRGGTIQSWWLETMANTKDAERCNSGILDLKTLDSLEGYDGLPYTVPSLPPHLKDSPSKVRESARSAQRVSNGSARSSTPPPLPKSASLPLHAPRLPQTPSKGDKAVAQRNAPPTSATATTVATTPQPPQPVVAPVPSQTPSSTSSFYDQTPVIADILRQISASSTAVHDLRTQLADFQSAAAESRSSIQSDLEAHRERKRTEDASRNELKTRSKALDDSKRAAEASKREAEKKLKAAESARDNASERIERLDKEIERLRQKMSEDEQAMVQCKEEGDKAEAEMLKQLEMKRKEIGVAENVVAALNVRAKELEEKIVAEEERLKKAKEQAELRRQDRAFFPLHVVQSQEPTSWTPIPSIETPDSDPHSLIHTDRSENIEVFPPSLQFPQTRSRGGSGSSATGPTTDFSVSPRPRKLSLGVISNFREQQQQEHRPIATNPSEPLPIPTIRPHHHHGLGVHPSNGLPIFENGIPPVRAHIPRFSPFGDSEPIVDVGAPSPTSTSLIPTSLIQSLEGPGLSADDLSRSFQSDSDDVLERDWRKMHPFIPHPVESPSTFNSSPTSLNHPGFDGIDQEDPFEVRPPPPPPTLLQHQHHQRLATSASDGNLHTDVHYSGNNFPHPNRASTDPQPLGRSRTREDENGQEEKSVGHKRWFSTSKEKKGLNPEAKVFQLKNTLPLFNHNRHDHQTHQQPQAYEPGTIIPLPPNLSPSAHPLPPPSSASSNGNGNNGMMNGINGHAPTTTDSFFSTISMRAFAPSPAEREALTRALGSSTNTSLERLPTLSEVSIASMPPSPPLPPPHPHPHPHSMIQPSHIQPSHIQTARSHPDVGDHTNSRGSSGSSVMTLPPGLAWLHSLPRMRKSKFSPWDDEEPSSPSPSTSADYGNGNGNASF